MNKLTSYILPGNKIDPQRWDTFIHNSPQGAIYALAGYASLVREDWQAIIVEKKGEWQAVMPFCLNRRWGFNYLPQPMFAQHWGIFLAPDPYLSVRKNYSWKAAVIHSLADHLAGIHLIIQNFSPAFDYPVPFHWLGYTLRTRYTYHLDLTPDISAIQADLSPALSRQIKKATRNGLETVRLNGGNELEVLFRHNRSQGHNIVGNDESNYRRLNDISTYLLHTGQGSVLGIRNEDGKIIAAAVFAQFRNNMLYLMGAQHPDFSQSGAGSLIVWEGIKQAKTSGHKIFDFEGSMIRGVEHFFRKFGAKPVSYLQIYKNRLPLPLRWIQESQ